jgi:drug/metabolite transporter (DMT)-like permease
VTADPTSAPRPAASPSSGLGVAAVLVAVTAWSVAPTLVKSTDMTGLRFAMYRLWVGVAIYGLVLLFTRRRITWRTFRAVAPGGLVFGVDISLAFLAFTLTSVASATVIGALSPVVIALVSARLLREHVGSRERVLAVMSFVGVAVVATGSSGSSAWSLWGDLAALASIGTWTTYWFFSRRARATVPAIEYMTCVMLAAALLVTPVALVVGGGPLVPSGNDLVAIVTVAFVAGLIGHTLVAWSHSHVESWRAALITQCHPVLASVWAWLFLDERIGPLAAVGVVIVLVATGAVILRASRRPGLVDDLDEAAEPPA